MSLKTDVITVTTVTLFIPIFGTGIFYGSDRKWKQNEKERNPWKGEFVLLSNFSELHAMQDWRTKSVSKIFFKQSLLSLCM